MRTYRWLILFAVLLGACSSTLVDATVTKGWRPAVGVDVAMDCPQVIKSGGPSVFGKTDENGRLEFREPAGGRWLHDGCDIIIGTRHIPVKDVCAEYSANHCMRVVVTTDLTNEPDAGAVK